MPLAKLAAPVKDMSKVYAQSPNLAARSMAAFMAGAGKVSVFFYNLVAIRINFFHKPLISFMD